MPIWIFALAYMLIVVMAQLRAPLDLYEYEFHPINGGPEENENFDQSNRI